MLGFEKIEGLFKVVFKWYGGIITKYHWIFIIVTLVVTCGMIPGLLMIKYEGDVYELFTPDDARSKEERAIYEDLFLGVGDENTLPSRLIHDTRIGQVIFQAKDDYNILTSDVMQEILDLHQLIRNITVYDGENNELSFQFEDLCLKWEGECLENSVLDFYDYNAEEVDKIEATHPYATNPEDEVFYLGGDLGGITVDEDRRDDEGNAPIEHVEAMRITYFLRAIKDEEKRRGARWEKAFQQVVRDFENEKTKVVSSTSELVNQEIDATINDAIYLGVITFWVLIVFCTVACMMSDWVLSKPWLGIVGLLTAFLSLIGAFGVMGYIGIPFAVLAGATPFLIIGIGLDDTYVALSAWRQTDIRDSVKLRLSDALADAAMSITITSLTDALAFGIGAISNFPAIRYFSIYCGVAVTFCYLYQLLFFAPCLAIAGHREKAKRHACCCCLPAIPKNDSPNCCKKWMCGGGSPRQEDMTPCIMNFFNNIYGPIVNKYLVMGFVIVIYLLYMGVSIWGCTLIERGLPEEKLVRDGSEAREYYTLKSEYFGLFGPQIALIVTSEIDYSDPDVQYELEYAQLAMEHNQHVLDKEMMFTVSWLRTYLQFLQATCLLPLPPPQFVEVLRTRFLTESQFKQFTLDIIFNEDNSSIISSRFFLSTNSTANIQKHQSQLTSDLRRTADQSVLPLIVYSPTFLFSDQYLSMWSNTWQSLGITFAVMFGVSLLLIPYLTCAFVVTLSVASIVVGVMGFMGHWHISLSPVSMINLILCIGFSVDFSAHICYAFVVMTNENKRRSYSDPIEMAEHGNRGRSRTQRDDEMITVDCYCYKSSLPTKPTNEERSVYSLYSLGLPIVQGAISTILSVLALVFSTAYVFQVFFKTMFLVISFGALHGIVFLPVLLRLLVGKGEQMIAKFLQILTMCCALGIAKTLLENPWFGFFICFFCVSWILGLFGIGWFVYDPVLDLNITVILPTPDPLCPLPTFPPP